jgi:hypothetical protein
MFECQGMPCASLSSLLLCRARDAATGFEAGGQVRSSHARIGETWGVGRSLFD